MKTHTIALALVSFAGSAYADNCGPIADVHRGVTEKYQEQKVFSGMTEGGVVEIWANLRSGTWTALAYPFYREGVACLVASGGEAHQTIGGQDQ